MSTGSEDAPNTPTGEDAMSSPKPTPESKSPKRKTPLKTAAKVVLDRIRSSGSADSTGENSGAFSASEGDPGGGSRRSPVRLKIFHRRSRSQDSNASAGSESDDGMGSGRRRRAERRGSLLRRDATRQDHLRLLLRLTKERKKYFESITSMLSTRPSSRVEDLQQKLDDSVFMFPEVPLGEDVSESQRQQIVKETETLKKILRKFQKLPAAAKVEFPIDVRLKELFYIVPVDERSTKIKTVYNSSFVYEVVHFFKRLWKGEKAEQMSEKAVLDDITLRLRPGTQYLVLGPPRSGKSSLLRAISGRLAPGKRERIEGDVSYNGKTFKDKTDIHIDNAIAFIDQLDRHAPRFTVWETFDFAYLCKRGVSGGAMVEGEDGEQLKDLHDQRLLVTTVLESLGLSHVQDTFVGNDDIRGVSGGQRRRVTVGEMLMDSTPILCGDEISNGLDASSTFEIIQILTLIGRIMKRTRVISLLQPSPETVSLFDEIILIAEGKVLYCGPVSRVEDYFASLGYHAPPQMDVADFLQLLSTPDAEHLYDPRDNGDSFSPSYHTADQLAEIFKNSRRGQDIRNEVAESFKEVFGSAHGDVEEADVAVHLDDSRLKKKYANSFPVSAWLNLRRELILWKRDTRFLRANAIKNIVMGISVGGVFFQTDDVVSILGVLFQGMLFIMLGAMTVAPGFVDERIIYYKQADANFFSAYPFIFGKAWSKVPQTIMDCIFFGTILYFMVGLATTAKNFFIFMGIIIVFNIFMNELLFSFATVAKSKATVQVIAACLVFFFILFCGFIIAPDTVPSYYTWLYWWNPMAWAYRAVIVNEFRSDEYTKEEGDTILIAQGFVDEKGKPFTQIWVLYCFVYLLCYTLISMIVSVLGLTYVRPVPDVVSDDETNHHIEVQSDELGNSRRMDFKPVTMTFENICYDVQASKSSDKLRLLDNVSGVFKAGRMCALMGSSGAGKTTLMDVIAMRKSSGEVQGEVRLNGFLQDPVSFRRCSGFVEQFDVQSPQLTVRETILFSARLRLDPRVVESDEEKQAFSDMVIKTLELSKLENCLVGSDEEGGLSFEQRKRLSIAVELAASPSIIFLDEPTTGLDARSALLVVKLLRKIASEGRTICATIHQPSSQIFDLFDDLLLLQKGGQVVFSGELGQNSENLIRYFETRGAKPIDLGENAANWMLREMQVLKDDLNQVYLQSEEHTTLKTFIADANANPDTENKIEYADTYAVPRDVRQKLVNKRLQTIYWRSPSYNLSRLLVSCVIAFILGSVFIRNRRPESFTEGEVKAWLSITFLSFIITGILAITSVLPVMLLIRDMFYKHRSQGMLNDVSLAWALGTAEKWFIVLASALFCLVYIGVGAQQVTSLARTVRFWGIFTFNLAIYSYFGQAFMCCVRGMSTAQILASVFIGLNNFFSGLIVRPQFMTGIFQVTYWITPGHYVYEGLVTAQMAGDTRSVSADPGSGFFTFLNCGAANSTSCSGSVEDYVEYFFGGRFSERNELQDILVLTLFLVLARISTYYALKYFNYSTT